MPEIPKTETLIIPWDSNPAHPIPLTKEEISAALSMREFMLGRRERKERLGKKKRNRQR